MHFEIGCKHSARTQDFYAKLFGWKITQMGAAGMIDTGGLLTGHFTTLGHEPHQCTIFYVQVADVQKPLDQTQLLGGKRLVLPTDIPGGTFACMQDPEGNTIGLWKPKG